MKKVMSLWGCFLITIALTGCAGSFDVSDYMKALLDASFKNDTELLEEYTDDPQEIEEIKSGFSKGVEEELKNSDLPEDVQQECKELMLDIIKNAKYTVGESEETEDGYKIPIDVEPISGIFDDLEVPVKEDCEAYWGSIKEDLYNGSVTRADIEDNVYKIFFDNVRENMENISYKDAQTITVELTEDEDGVTLKEPEALGRSLGETLINPSEFEGFDLWETWEEASGSDAAGCVEAMLDLITKGDLNKIKIFLEDPDEITEEYYQQLFSEGLGSAFEGQMVSEEAQQGLEDLYKKLLTKTRYTVGETKKVSDDYTVDVSIEPVVGAFTGLDESLRSEITAYAEANVEGIANGTITETDISNVVISLLIKIVDGNIDHTYYGDVQTVTVNVTSGEEGYDIPDEDMGRIWDVLIDTSGLDGLL